MMADLMTYREGDRSYPSLWFLRAVGLVVTIITLGLTAASTASFGASACGTPGKLSYNLAVTVISFVALIYLLLSTGPSRSLKILPWFIFGQLALDAVLFVFWLAAAASANLSCDDLCNACNGLYGQVYYGTTICDCFTFFREKRATSPNPAKALLGKRDATGSNGGIGAATIAFDAIMTVLFAVCLAATIFWFFESRKSSHTGGAIAPPPVAGEPVKHEEAGMAAPTATPGYSQAGGPNVQYTHQQTPQYAGQPPMQQQQPQPTMHQVPYNQSAPQPQYQQPQAQQAPQMSATGGPMQDHYAPASPYSTPPPQEGTVEMPNVGQKTADGTAAPEVHGQTPD